MDGLDNVHIQLSPWCIPNLVVGREGKLSHIKRTRTDLPKKLVVGSGPGETRAAKAAAERGHSIYLFEKGSHLGGNVLNMLKVPTRAGYESVLRYLIQEVDRLGVELNLSHEESAADINALSPDIVWSSGPGRSRSNPRDASDATVDGAPARPMA